MLGQCHESRKNKSEEGMSKAGSTSPPQLNQDCLHGILTLPLEEAWQSRWVDLLSGSAPCFDEHSALHTLPVLWSTHGRLILETNCSVGGASG